MKWEPALIRIDIMMLAVIVLCALGTVSAQHKWRTLFKELEVEQEYTQHLETEYGQLQLELSTWAAHPRIEKIAHERLQMQVPDLAKIMVIDPGRQ